MMVQKKELDGVTLFLFLKLTRFFCVQLDRHIGIALTNEDRFSLVPLRHGTAYSSSTIFSIAVPPGSYQSGSEYQIRRGDIAIDSVNDQVIRVFEYASSRLQFCLWQDTGLQL